ncbi:MAG: hypothetical protein NZX77_00170, partial [Polyangiaceae bacterium]|nr:hypothetical protein [Polyangiaceae bacterium]
CARRFGPFLQTPVFLGTWPWVRNSYIDLNSGLWLQAGPSMNTKGRFGGSVAVGFSLFGVELQRRHVDGLGEATVLLGKLRIPLGVLAFALAHNN